MKEITQWIDRQDQERPDCTAYCKPELSYSCPLLVPERWPGHSLVHRFTDTHGRVPRRTRHRL